MSFCLHSEYLQKVKGNFVCPVTKEKGKKAKEVPCSGEPKDINGCARKNCLNRWNTKPAVKSTKIYQSESEDVGTDVAGIFEDTRFEE